VRGVRCEVRGVRCEVAALLLALVASGAGAQARVGTLSGFVRDADKRPIADVEVALRPSGKRARTDSTGRYEITGLGPGSYVAMARRPGWRPEQWEVSMTRDVGALADFTVATRDRDPIHPDSNKKCEGFSLAGFECRKTVVGGGRGSNPPAMFYDFPDIDSQNRVMTADLFRDIPGFRVMIAEGGGRIVEPSRGSSCIYFFTDGKPATEANPVPPQARDVYAMEIYRTPDHVPVHDLRELRRGSNVGTLGNCRVVLVWTMWSKPRG
jgi:hypothetical protein